MATKHKTPTKTVKKPTAKAPTKSPTKPPKRAAPTSTVSQQPPTGIPAGTPIFADPRPTADPTKYTVPHASDTAAYNEMDALIKASKFVPLPFPAVPGVTEPILTLAATTGLPVDASPAAAMYSGYLLESIKPFEQRNPDAHGIRSRLSGLAGL